MALAHRVRKRLGRRGTALVLLGSGKICYGLGFILAPGPDPRGLDLLTRWADIRCWAALWVVCGAVTFASAFLRIGQDGLGFKSALIPPFIWGTAFLWGAMSGEFARGFTTFGWYMTGHIGMILWASSVPEYSLPHAAPQKGGAE
jgi:hypothetical protein